jgi:hypothetical protein
MSEFSVGREPLQIVEIDQPICIHTYGEAPCTAVFGVTSDRRCFNTSRTCQDLPNYATETLTLRFAKAQQGLPDDLYLIPSLVSATTSPTEVNVVGTDSSKGPLGIRAKLSVTFQDHPHSDLLVDKYRLGRGYIATSRGTFWSKWLARNPYHNQYVIRVRDGYVGQSLAEMRSRTYFIDRISGPNSSGKVVIEAKDVLKLADNDKAQAPAASPGELRVDYTETAAISFLSVTRAAITDYPSPGTVRVNEEIFTHTGTSFINETEIRLTGIVRSTDGTKASSHDSGDRVQRCLRYSEVRPDILTKDLLTNYGFVPAAFIPDADWSAEASVWLEQFRLTALITEPTGVTDLLGEITEQALFYIWWDERDQQVKLRALRAVFDDQVTAVDDTNHIIKGTIEVKKNPKERMSQVWLFFQQRDPTQKLDEEKNFRRVRIRVDADAESDLQYGEQRIKKIYSRWIQTDAVAIQTNTRLLSRFRDTPEYLAFRLDAKDRALWTADIIDATVDQIVDDTGAPISARWQIISAEEVVPGEIVEYKAQFFEFLKGDRFAFIMANDAPTYAAASESQRAIGGFSANLDEVMPGGDPPYLLQ